MARSRRQVVSAVFAALLALSLGALTCAPFARADAGHSEVAPTSAASTREVGYPGMEPIAAEDVVDGTYPIEVESSSTFFKVEKAELKVEGGQMTAKLTMYTSSYSLLYMGTGEQAAAAPATDYIEFNRDDWSFTVPVEALDYAIDCAAFSKRRHKWYDRKLVFDASSLPQEALLVELPDREEGTAVAGDEVADAQVDSDGVPSAADGAGAVELDMPDGEYSIEVNMTGGSGRASVSSPTWLIVRNGRAYARLLWSSAYYDYMIVDELKYTNRTNDGGNSTFIIPILSMDQEFGVIADTTAMGDPVEIEYQLTFYSDTVGEKNLIPQEAAILVLEIGIAVIAIGGVLNFLVKRRRKR